METRYTVRQTVEMTGVKSYVLRYWEEELELQIHRNELGHRYYTGCHGSNLQPGNVKGTAGESSSGDGIPCRLSEYAYR